MPSFGFTPSTFEDFCYVVNDTEDTMKGLGCDKKTIIKMTKRQTSDFMNKMIYENNQVELNKLHDYLVEIGGIKKGKEAEAKKQLEVCIECANQYKK
tara:strand:- start:485 stop:775 length:291 start_codon:yes stop_codon:yes gene_type:complete